MSEYLKRIADQMLTDKLESSGAVLIEGPKYCGKTTLAKQQAKSVLSMAVQFSESHWKNIGPTDMF